MSGPWMDEVEQILAENRPRPQRTDAGLLRCRPIPTGGRTMAINAPPNMAGITSRDDGSDLDHIRTAILAVQIFAEGNHDDQKLAAVHKIHSRAGSRQRTRLLPVL